MTNILIVNWNVNNNEQLYSIGGYCNSYRCMSNIEEDVIDVIAFFLAFYQSISNSFQREKTNKLQQTNYNKFTTNYNKKSAK